MSKPEILTALIALILYGPGGGGSRRSSRGYAYAAACVDPTFARMAARPSPKAPDSTKENE
jgi:hypothetical protein